MQRDPGGSSERVSHEVLHCHVWEESKGVTHRPCSFFLLPLTPSLGLWEGRVGGKFYSWLLSQMHTEHLIPGRNRQERFVSHSLPWLWRKQMPVLLCGLWRWWWFLHQHKQLKDLPLLNSDTLLQGGEKYNAFLWDTSVMEEQAGHIHVYGFKMGRTPGALHTLQFSEVWNIFRSECRVTSALCRKPA